MYVNSTIALMLSIIGIASILALMLAWHWATIICFTRQIYWPRAEFPISVIHEYALDSRVLMAFDTAIEFWNSAIGKLLFCEYPIGKTNPRVSVHLDKHVKIASTVLCIQENIVMEAKILINQDILLSYDPKTIDRVISHELGHVLCLDHDTDRDSVMYDRAICGEFKVLEEDKEILRKMLA